MDAATKKAHREYCSLPAVARDTAATIEDFVFDAEHEIDMHNEGENTLTSRELAKLKAFVAKYSPKPLPKPLDWRSKRDRKPTSSWNTNKGPIKLYPNLRQNRTDDTN